MFEISELKAKTLAELQQIAKAIGLKKISQLKKLDLVYQILDTQAANPTKTEQPKTERPKSHSHAVFCIPLFCYQTNPTDSCQMLGSQSKAPLFTTKSQYACAEVTILVPDVE